MLEKVMDIGISLPQPGPQATKENLIRAARRAQELGYDSVWVLERLLWPLKSREPYPATEDGSLPQTYKNVFDPIETLTTSPDIDAGLVRMQQLIEISRQ
jgi:alkanesulfonate monooxygenase SsuD/methylene tetrahydromethanopterin reductase-like flavin-dependent oxidoreductase (luciferase family)